MQIEKSWFKTWPGHCVGFLTKTFYPQSTSLNSDVIMGTNSLLGKAEKIQWSPWNELASHPGSSNTFITFILTKQGYISSNRVNYLVNSPFLNHLWPHF